MQLDPSLLAAVIADPDNDLPRLIAADWWQERGEEDRAEFIRMQCELVRIDHFDGCCAICGSIDASTHRGHCRIPDLRCRIGRSRQIGWLAGTILGQTRAVRGFDGISRMFSFDPEYNLIFDPGYSRGFVESIRCTLLQWRTHAQEIRSLCPLREVRMLFRGNAEIEEMVRVHGVEGAGLVLSESYPGIEFVPGRGSDDFELMNTTRGLAR